MALRKRKNTENRRIKYYIALAGELALEQVMDLS
jgi:hypothetical protein